jgi:NAD(P)H dehydrogenase (quinone)
MIIDGRASVPEGGSKIGYVTRADCAAAAAAVLTTAGHENKAYDITGPELLGPREIATAASAVTGKPIEIVPAGPGSGSPPRAFGGPSIEVVSTAVADLTGHPPTSLRELLVANRDKLPQ